VVPVRGSGLERETLHLDITSRWVSPSECGRPAGKQRNRVIKSAYCTFFPSALSSIPRKTSHLWARSGTLRKCPDSESALLFAPRELPMLTTTAFPGLLWPPVYFPHSQAVLPNIWAACPSVSGRTYLPADICLRGLERNNERR